MAIIVDEVTAPADWAPRLINGVKDGEGESWLDDDDDFLLFCYWLKENGFSVVSVVEGSERYTNSGKLYFSSYSGVTVCDYVLHKIEN